MFYVYAYLDPRKSGSFDYKEIHFDYEPFYIGKGKGDRDQVHLIEKDSGNRHKHNKIQQIIREGFEPIIIRLQEELSEQEAWDLEERLINLIGRSYYKTGPLTNLKDGGQGGFSHINNQGLKTFLVNKYGEEEGIRRCEEIWKKTGDRCRGIPRTEEIKEKIRGTLLDTYREHPEIIEQMSKSILENYQEHPELKDKLRETFAKTKKEHPEKFFNPMLFEEYRKKNSESQKGKKASEETRQKLREDRARRKKRLEELGLDHPNKGRKASEETKIKLSNSHKGLLVGERNPSYGKSTHQMMLEKYGPEEGEKKFEEYRQKLRDGKKKLKESGWTQKLSDETKQKMKEAQKRRREREKST